MPKANIPKLPPVWVMGMGNAVFGLVGGFLVLPLPQMLSAEGVPVWKIAAISTACFSPGFWTFALGPVLDLRFTRRWWATAFAGLAGLCMAAAILVRGHLLALEIMVMVAYTAATMSSNALGGWLASLVPEGDGSEAADTKATRFEMSVGAWTQVATFVGNGAMAVLAGELLRHAPGGVAAMVIGLIVMAPALLFVWIPVSAEERRLPWKDAGATFRGFGQELRLLARERTLWVTIALFVLPTGSFALTNLLGGVAADFHAPEEFASRIGGVILSLAGAGAALLVPVLARRVRPLQLYLAIGMAGCLLTLGMLPAPRTPAMFAVGFLGENVFQAMSFTAAVGIILAVIGRRNPLAGTTFGLLTGVGVLPILGMERMDGQAYSAHGVQGMLGVDGVVGMVACLGMVGVMRMLKKQRGKS